MNSPTPEQIRTTRTTAGLTQSQASALIYKKLRAWQYWESGEQPMDPAYWELFLLKVVEQSATLKI